jgi:hypothetical protein
MREADSSSPSRSRLSRRSGDPEDLASLRRPWPVMWIALLFWNALQF